MLPLRVDYAYIYVCDFIVALYKQENPLGFLLIGVDYDSHDVVRSLNVKASSSETVSMDTVEMLERFDVVVFSTEVSVPHIKNKFNVGKFDPISIMIHTKDRVFAATCIVDIENKSISTPELKEWDIGFSVIAKYRRILH